MILQAPSDFIIVQFEKKYQDEIITTSGIKFYKDTSYNPEWNATVSGKVVSVPEKLSQTDDFLKRIVPEVRPGDELFFSYLVVHDKKIPDNPEYFFEVSDPKSIHKELHNCFKEKIQVVAYSKNEYVGAFTKEKADGEIEVLSGIQGTPKQVGRWLSQFKIGQPDQAVYANLIWHNNEDFWKVHYMLAMAAKRGEEIIMIGGHCLLEPPEERMVYEMNEQRHLHLISKRDEGVAKLLHIGTPLKGMPVLDVQPGDMVRFDKRHAQQYELWGKKYFVLNQEKLVAKD